MTTVHYVIGSQEGRRRWDCLNVPPYYVMCLFRIGLSAERTRVYVGTLLLSPGLFFIIINYPACSITISNTTCLLLVFIYICSLKWFIISRFIEFIYLMNCVTFPFVTTLFFIEAIPLCSNIYFFIDILQSKTQLNIPTQWYNNISSYLGYIFRPQRAIMGSHWVHTLLELLYVLYWPDGGLLRPKHVENHELILLYHCVGILSCVLGGNISIKKYFTFTHWPFVRFNTLRTGLLNCLNARSRGLTFRHRASCV